MTGRWIFGTAVKALLGMAAILIRCLCLLIQFPANSLGGNRGCASVCEPATRVRELA